MEVVTVPEADYAVFTVAPGRDPKELYENIRKTWEEIFEWFHTDEEYRPTVEKDIFEYYCGDVTAIYVPVVKK